MTITTHVSHSFSGPRHRRSIADVFAIGRASAALPGLRHNPVRPRRLEHSNVEVSNWT